MFVLPSTIAGMESPSGPRLGKLSSSGLPRSQTLKLGHPQEFVRASPGPETNNIHSEWRVATHVLIKSATQAFVDIACS